MTPKVLSILTSTVAENQIQIILIRKVINASMIGYEGIEDLLVVRPSAMLPLSIVDTVTKVIFQPLKKYISAKSRFSYYLRH